MTHRERAHALLREVFWIPCYAGDPSPIDGQPDAPHHGQCEAMVAELEAVELETRRPTLIQCAEALALAGFAPAGLKVREWADIVDGWPAAQPAALPRGEVAETAKALRDRLGFSPTTRETQDRVLAENADTIAPGLSVGELSYKDETPPGKCHHDHCELPHCQLIGGSPAPTGKP